MNEVEKHYSGTSSTGHSVRETESSGIVDSVRSKATDALDSASSAYDTASRWGRETYKDTRQKLSGGVDSASRTVSGAHQHSMSELDRAREQVFDFVDDNPVMVGVVGLAAGLLLGALLPSTRRENQVFGRYADEVRDQGLRYARDLAEQGKQLVEESLHPANREPGKQTHAA